MSRMTNVFLFSGAAFLSMSAGPAFAQSCVGTCGTMGADGVVTAPPSGNPSYNYVSSFNGVAGAGSLAVGKEKSGSQYVTQSFSAKQGDVLRFNFDYVTTDGGTYTDYAWAALRSVSQPAVNNILFTARTTPSGNTVPGFGLPGLAPGVTLNPSSTPILSGTTWSALGTDSGKCFSTGQGCGNTGWISMTYAIGAADQYELVFGVTDLTDTDYASGLAYDAVTVNNVSVVPEPATWLMLLTGFFAVGGSLRSGRRRTEGRTQMA